MRILFIANTDKRRRYRFVMEPLRAVGVDAHCYEEKSNLIATFFYGIKVLLSKPKSHIVVLTGGDLRNVIWFLILRIFTRMRVVVRFGGDPITVRRSAQSSFSDAKNIFATIRTQLGAIGSRLLLKHVDGVIVVSVYLAKAVEPLLGSKSHIVVSPPMLLRECKPKRSYQQNGEMFSVLTVTNLNYSEKADGVLHIANAIRSLGQNQPDIAIHFDIVGGGLRLTQVQHAIENMTLPRNVTISVHGQQTDVSSFYESADLFVYHSELDSYSLVMMEAAAYGLPLIVNRWGPFPLQYVEGKEALFYETGNTYQLENLLSRLVKDEKERASLGRAVLHQYQQKQSTLPRGEKLVNFFSELIQ